MSHLKKTLIPKITYCVKVLSSKSITSTFIRCNIYQSQGMLSST